MVVVGSVSEKVRYLAGRVRVRKNVVGLKNLGSMKVGCGWDILSKTDKFAVSVEVQGDPAMGMALSSLYITRFWSNSRKSGQ